MTASSNSFPAGAGCTTSRTVINPMIKFRRSAIDFVRIAGIFDPRVQ